VTAQAGDRPHVLLVDDHALLAESLAWSLEAVGEVRAAVTHDVSAEAVLAQVATLRPTLVLLDLDLGTHGDAVPLLRELTARGVQVAVLTGSADRLRHAVCLEAGAVAVLLKTQPLKDLAAGVGRLARGGPVPGTGDHATLREELRRHRAAEDARWQRFRELTPREREVLAGLLAGRNVAEMAEATFLSQATIRTQVRGVLTKLGVRSQVDAIAAARDAGWHPGI
jgi:two-component system nitrate/nitrite response regulator NarL